jgi:phosphoribosylformylglycinamidine synthase
MPVPFLMFPVVGGNVSLYNEHGDGAIDPTPVVSMVGLIDKQEHVTQSQVEAAGLETYPLGGMALRIRGKLLFADPAR